MPALISYRNWADEDGVVIALHPDFSEVPEYPLSNLTKRPLSEVARWTGTGPSDVGRVIFDVTLAGTRSIDVIGLLALNANQADHISYMTISLYQGPTLLEEYAVVDNQDAGAPDRPFLLVAVLARLDGVAPTADRVLISAEWNAIDAEFSESARLWIADGVYLPDGLDQGWALYPRDPGIVEESDGLEAYEDPKDKVRILEMPVSAIDTTIAWGFADDAVTADDVPSFNGLQLAKGLTGDVLAVARAETPVWVSRTAIYGRCMNPVKILHQSGPNWTANATVLEER